MRMAIVRKSGDKNNRPKPDIMISKPRFTTLLVQVRRLKWDVRLSDFESVDLIDCVVIGS